MNLNHNKFRIKEYRIALKGWGIPEEGVFCFLTDLHGKSFGENNELLIRAIKHIDPHLILCGGDMNVRSEPPTLDTAYSLLSSLAGFRPVVMAPGNHESGMGWNPEFRHVYYGFLKELKRAGVSVLRNKQLKMNIMKQQVVVTGTDLPRRFYRKPFGQILTSEKLAEFAGSPDPASFNLLLSHNPRYADAYFGWGADLTLSGHTHGGVLRLGEHTGFFSPQDLFFSKILLW